MKIQRKDEWGKKYQVWVSRDGINCEIMFVEKDTSDEEILKRAETLFTQIDSSAKASADKTIADNLLDEKLELVKDIPIKNLKTKLGIRDVNTY